MVIAIKGRNWLFKTFHKAKSTINKMRH
uniref:Uncharacterized protein n=1 Tax=Rhizophora mucronata TaxID=61149 RepID=A0A2P2QXT9_RHIMU